MSVSILLALIFVLILFDFRIKDLEARAKQDNNAVESLQFELRAKTDFW